MAASLAALIVSVIAITDTASTATPTPIANGKIAFASFRDGNGELYVINPDGSNLTRLTNNSANEEFPAWSPDGAKIAFVSDRDGNAEIYVMGADGSNQTRLTNNSAFDYYPAWSPDGAKIAFVSLRDGNGEAYVMNADGTNPTRLTNNSGHDDMPAWSPDGTKIAFVSQRDGNDEVYVMNADGSNPTRLTNNSAFDIDPTWSPDAAKIAFVSLRDGNNEIYAMNADGSNPTRLTTNSTTDENPAWSPDGAKIAFDSGRDGNWEIYVMGADGSNQTRLTNNTAVDLEPDWQRIVATPPTPTLGNYLATFVPLSGDTTVAPSAAPTNTTNINVSTSTNFKGKLEANPATGAVHVTDAQPAGTYAVTVKAFNGSNGPTTTKTFTLTVTTPPTCNPVSFSHAIIDVGDRVGGVLVGDFNGDGKQDLAAAAVTAVFSQRTLILLGDGTGHFNFLSEVPIGARAVGDFNGDGKQDLVALDSSNAVIYLGDGSGHFSFANGVDTGCAAPFQLAVADFNGDGRLDLATACFFANSVTIMLGDGAGNFGTPASFSVSNGPQGLVVGDFNSDGKQDLAVACQPAGVVSILIGDGAGSFGPATNFNAGATPRDIEVGDFNGDGKQDLAVSNPTANAASIMLGDGAGGFGPPTSFTVGSNPTTVIAIGDFNGDGKQDLAVPNFDSANVSILLGDGAGAFAPAINLSVFISPFGVAVGDFNGDGKQDLATANWNSKNVSILLRDCTNTTAGSNIIVDPVDSTTGNPGPVTLNFSQVNVGGTTSVTSSSNNPGPSLPSKFKIGDPPTYYDITTTAQFTAPVTVCVQYPDTAYQVDEANLKLLHFDGAAWVDITTSANLQTNTVCGVTSSLSPFVVAEQDVDPPNFTVPSNISITATSSSGAAVSYDTPIASDDFDGTVPVSCSPQSDSTFALGTTHVTCSATDSAGNPTQKSFDVIVTYAWSGVLQPINPDGSSIFKLGSTVAVKFALTGASAAVPNAVARLYCAKLSNNVAGTDLEATSTASASTGNLFRYDAATGQYVFNWGTKALTAGTYQLKVDLGDGAGHIVLVSLK
jgi:Tol biopolymer transport system component